MGGELGLVVEGDQTVYFAGDTSLDRELFLTIGHRWSPDAVLLPVGDVRILGIPIRHLGPKTAPRALRLLGEPRFVVPIHYGGMSLAPFVTFKGTPRKLSQSIEKSALATVVGTTRPLETLEIQT
jgi:L-ascorbate metabolism protein UlaG (beta-lactamase superfamily)